MPRSPHRLLLLLLAMLGAAAVMAGCGSDKGASSTGNGATTPAAGTTTATTPAATAKASGSLTIWTEDYYVKIFRPLVKPWEQETGVKVRFVTKDFSQMTDQFIAAVPAGAGPDLLIAPTSTAKLVKNGVVAPVDLGAKAGALNPEAAKAVTSGGTVYGVPFDVENIALYRNTKLAPDTPKTFDDAVSTGKKLVSAGKAKNVFGIGLDPKAGNSYLMYPLMTSFGADIFGKTADGEDDPAKLRLDDEAGLKFASALSKWGKTKALNPNLASDIALKQFTDGKAPYYLSGPWDLEGIKASKVPYSIDTIPTTGDEPAAPFIGNYGVYASAKAKNPLAASLFVSDFMVRKETQLGIWKAGRNPPALTEAADQVADDPDVKAFLEVAKVAKPFPSIPAMDTVSGPWGNAEMQILRGKGGDPQTVWKKMAAGIRAEIKKG